MSSSLLCFFLCYVDIKCLSEKRSCTLINMEFDSQLILNDALQSGVVSFHLRLDITVSVLISLADGLTGRPLFRCSLDSDDDDGRPVRLQRAAATPVAAMLTTAPTASPSHNERLGNVSNSFKIFEVI
jgi:hypothetical protein